MSSITELIDEVSALTKLTKETDGTLRSLTKEFEEREDVQSLAKLISEQKTQLAEKRDELTEVMIKENVKAQETDKGRASIGYRVKLEIPDEEKLCAAILEDDSLDGVREFIVQKSSIANRKDFGKAMQELLEIEEPDILKELGVELAKIPALTITPRKDEGSSDS